MVKSNLAETTRCLKYSDDDSAGLSVLLDQIRVARILFWPLARPATGINHEASSLQVPSRDKELFFRGYWQLLMDPAGRSALPGFLQDQVGTSNRKLRCREYRNRAILHPALLALCWKPFS